MRYYLDASAAMKLVVDEAESDALLERILRMDAADRVIASWLLHTELRCAAGRRPGVVVLRSVVEVLGTVLLVDLTRADLLAASELGRGLRSQDAIHLAVAVRTACDAMVTYDAQQAAAARAHGLEVLQPA